MTIKIEIDVLHHYFLQRIIIGIKRLQENQAVNKKQLTPRLILIKMLNMSHTSTFCMVNFYIAFSFTFAGFFLIC